MNPIERYNIFSKISLAIVGFYSVINIPLLLSQTVDDNIFNAPIYFIDAYTWHIYGLFAIISFIVKLFMEKENNKEKYKLNIVLHTALMLISFAEILYIFGSPF